MSEVAGDQRVVRVLPDVAAIDKEFDYLVADGTSVHVGDVVRIQLNGRRVGAWVTAVDVDPVPGVALKPLAKVSGRGPSPELLDLATWAADRWVGRRASFLRTASPPGVVRGTPPVPGTEPDARLGAGPGTAAATGSSEPTAPDHVVRALRTSRAVLRLGPGADRYGLVRAAAMAEPAGGQVLVLVPSVAEAETLGRRFRREGIRTAIVAGEQRGAAATGEWAQAAFGLARVVVGARAGAWASVRHLDRVVVLDEHDEVYQQEQAPTWNAREVVVERARRAGVPCLLVSPVPSLEALGWGELITVDRMAERASWPRVEVIDQRDLDPALGPLFSPRLVDLLRSPGRVLCVLNRVGRARLLACGSCSTLARCEVCEAAVHQVEAATTGGDATSGLDQFECGRCGTRRPMVCTACGGHRFKNLRLGVSRAREELEALAGEPVHEVTASTPDGDPSLGDARVLVGTEAVLHRVAKADAVAFLDFDQELLSLRYRSAEQALALLARAGRIVQRGAGGGSGGSGAARGLVLVQTRTPEHPALVAAHHADPGRLVGPELDLRRTLGLPPVTAMALISGAGAPAFVDELGSPPGVRVQGPVDDVWRVVAPDHATLSAALVGVPRPAARLRLEVDPLRT